MVDKVVNGTLHSTPTAEACISASTHTWHSNCCSNSRRMSQVQNIVGCQYTKNGSGQQCTQPCKWRAPYLAGGCVLCNKAKEGYHGEAAVLDLIVLQSTTQAMSCVQSA